MNVQACNKQVTNKTLHHLAKTSLLFRLLSFGSMFVNRHGTGVVSFLTITEYETIDGV